MLNVFSSSIDSEWGIHAKAYKSFSGRGARHVDASQACKNPEGLVPSGIIAGRYQSDSNRTPIGLIRIQIDIISPVVG